MSFEFNLDSLKQAGSALKNIFNKKEEDPRTETEKLKDFQTAKEEYTPTEYQKQLGETEDARAAKESDIITGAEAIKKETQEKKDSEAELDKKLKNIQKVLKEFGDDQAPTVTNIPDILSIADTADKMNIQPIDMGTVRQKELMAQLPKLSSEKDRIELLYQDLIKRNLI
jgi:hypothetical protein